jgi:hypothetical protein
MDKSPKAASMRREKWPGLPGPDQPISFKAQIKPSGIDEKGRIAVILPRWFLIVDDPRSKSYTALSFTCWPA